MTDLQNDPQLKEAARLVALEFRNAAQLLRKASTLPPSAPLSPQEELQLLTQCRSQLTTLSTQVETEASTLSPDHVELLSHIKSALEHLTAYITSVQTTHDTTPLWNADRLEAAQWLAADAALLVSGYTSDSTDESLPSGRAVHFLRQLLPLVVAATDARAFGEISAPAAPQASLPLPETLHPALAVVGLVAGISSFLRQVFYSSLASPST